MAKPNSLAHKIFVAFEILVFLVLLSSGAFWLALKLNAALELGLFDPQAVPTLSRLTGWIAALTCALLPFMEMFRRQIARH